MEREEKKKKLQGKVQDLGYEWQTKRIKQINEKSNAEER